AIAVRAKDFVREVPVAVWAGEGTNVFPDDLLVGCHLENASPLTLADQSVPTPEPLGSTDVRAEERAAWPAAIFPNRPTRAGLEFDDSRKRVPIDIAAICKKGDVSVRERLAVVLHAPAVIAMLPFHPTTFAIDEPNHVEAAEAN